MASSLFDFAYHICPKPSLVRANSEKNFEHTNPLCRTLRPGLLLLMSRSRDRLLALAGTTG
jgi:hypothetical protein